MEEEETLLTKLIDQTNSINIHGISADDILEVMGSSEFIKYSAGKNSTMPKDELDEIIDITMFKFSRVIKLGLSTVGLVLFLRRSPNTIVPHEYAELIVYIMEDYRNMGILTTVANNVNAFNCIAKGESSFIPVTSRDIPVNDWCPISLRNIGIPIITLIPKGVGYKKQLELFGIELMYSGVGKNDSNQEFEVYKVNL